MRKFLLVTGLALISFVSAAQALDCPKQTIEIQLRDESPETMAKIESIRPCFQQVAEANAQQLTDEVVYVLRLTDNKDVESFYGTLKSALGEDRDEHDAPYLDTKIIDVASPFYGLAKRALDDLMSRSADDHLQPVALIELISSVTSANAVVEARWPAPWKRVEIAIKAEGK